MWLEVVEKWRVAGMGSGVVVSGSVSGRWLVNQGGDVVDGKGSDVFPVMRRAWVVWTFNLSAEFRRADLW